MVEVKDGKTVGKSVYGVQDGSYYSLEEYCIIYNLKLETVRQWKKRGHIRAVTLYGRVYIPSDEPPYEGKNGRPKRSKTSQTVT